MFFLVVAVLLVSAHADPTPSISHLRFPVSRVYGSENTTIESHPYQISLQYFGYHICGGAIISAHYVLTVAHCVGESVGSLTVRAGSAIRAQGGSVHQVKAIVHEKYRVNEHNVPRFDVALLRVDPPFRFDETRQPIDLFEKTDKLAPGEMAVITGWGYTNGNGYDRVLRKLPEQLQAVKLPVMDSGLCNEVYESFGGLPVGQFCGGYYGFKNTCPGDSGGPVVVNGRLAGVASWALGCVEAYFPRVYTDVAFFRDWIDQHVEF